MSTVTAVVDAHVHIHPCYRPDDLLSNAYANLSAALAHGPADPWARSSGQGHRVPPENRALFLLMTECASDDYFGALYGIAHGDAAGSERLALRHWMAVPTEEENSVLAVSGERQLFIVAGRQIACREGLEVLVIGTTRRLPDGLPIREVLSETAGWGVPRVIPWGPGKWLFKRGRLLGQLLEEFRRPTLFLGDEGGRPVFWGYPHQFERAARIGVRDLPGTDPLPFAHDVTKVGRMGLRVRIDLDRAHPAASLLDALSEPTTALERFAVLESPLRFVRNQIGMQLRKRRLA
jgi:hypothetical protein